MLLRKRQQNLVESNREESEPLEEEKQQSYTQIIRDLKSEVSKLKNELDEKKEDNEVRNKYADLLSDLFFKGIIDENGKFIKEKDEEFA